MDSTCPDNPKQFINIQKAAKILAVSVKTLLDWNENNILKANITPEGEIGYTQDQLNQFLEIRKQQPKSENDQYPSNRFSVSNKPSSTTMYQRILNWLGEQFYEDEYIKDFLKSQVRQSFTFTLRPPSKRVFSITTGIIFILITTLLTQQNHIKSLFENYKGTSNRQIQSNVLSAEISKLKLAGIVTMQTPLIGKENVSFEKNLYVQGEGVFVGNITAPNIIYEVREGDNIIITEKESQRPIISADLSGTVSTIQGQSGEIVLQPGTDIAIDGLTINNISTLP